MTWYEIIIQLIIPIVSVLLSIWFASSAKNNSEKAQHTLDEINKSIKGWVDQIINSTNDIIQSNPTIVDNKVKLAKIESVKGIVKTIETCVAESMKDPKPGAGGHTQEQLLKELMSSLEKMIDKMEK